MKVQAILMPKGCITMSAVEDGDHVAVYATIDADEKDVERREFLMYETDEKIEQIAGLKFLGTVKIKTATRTIGAGLFKGTVTHNIPDVIYHVYEKICVEEMLRRSHGVLIDIKK